jgi:hypothetical protein
MIAFVKTHNPASLRSSSHAIRRRGLSLRLFLGRGTRRRSFPIARSFAAARSHDVFRKLQPRARESLRGPARAGGITSAYCHVPRFRQNRQIRTE